MPYGQAPPPAQTDYRQLEELLSTQFDVRRIELKDDLVPSDIDVLVLGKVGALTANQRFAIDQYLMGGGTIVALAGTHAVEPEFIGQSQQIPPTFKDVSLKDDLSALLENYGVKVLNGLVVDERALDIVYPVMSSFNRVQISQTPYPYFVETTRESFQEGDHFALEGLNSVSFLWSSPLQVSDNLGKDVTAHTLVRSSDRSWVDESISLKPDVAAGDTERGAKSLVVTLEGNFKSALLEEGSKPIRSKVKLMSLRRKMKRLLRLSSLRLVES